MFIIVCFRDLYLLESLASFVAGFFSYEVLQPADAYPTSMPSLSCTYSSRRGDSFDLSLFLVSCLLGAGFDAYCVVGTAPQHITNNDQVINPKP